MCRSPWWYLRYSITIPHATLFLTRYVRFHRSDGFPHKTLWLFVFCSIFLYDSRIIMGFWLSFKQIPIFWLIHQDRRLVQNRQPPGTVAGDFLHLMRLPIILLVHTIERLTNVTELVQQSLAKGIIRLSGANHGSAARGSISSLLER